MSVPVLLGRYLGGLVLAVGIQEVVVSGFVLV